MHKDFGYTVRLVDQEKVRTTNETKTTQMKKFEALIFIDSTIKLVFPTCTWNSNQHVNHTHFGCVTRKLGIVT